MKSKAAAARADPGGAPGSASAWAARQTCIGCSQLGVPCVRPKNSSQCSQCTLRGVACVLPRPEGKWTRRGSEQRAKPARAPPGAVQRQEAYQAALRAALASSGEGAEGGPPIELVGPSIAAMADYATEWVALLQSTVFEDAFLRGSCPIYGSPPLALLHSVISMGVRLSVKIAAPPTQRMEWSTWHLERAADLLSRGYFTPPTKEQRTVSDIEALQTIIIIFFSSVTAGLGVRYLPLLAKGAEIAKAVCLMGPLPASQGSFPPASNYVEWILDEMRMRAYISYFLLDLTYSYFGKRQPFIDYFAQPFRLPCSEHYFCSPTPEAAFELVRTEQGSSSLVKSVDLGQLLFNPDPGVRAALVREIVAPIFTRARTLQGVVVLGGLMRLQRIRVRQFAADNEVDPFSLAGKLAQIGFDGEADTRINYLEPSEIEYLNMTMQMEEIVSFFKAALPDEVASILASDNITPIFDNGSLFFGDSRRSHSFIQSCTILPDTLVENWTDEDLITTAAFRSPSKVGPSDSRSMLKFLSSPIFHRVSENAIWSTRMMEGQLAADPNLLYLRIATTLNKVRIGAFHLAAWKMHFSALAMDPFASSDPVRVAAMTGLERDVKTAAAWVFAVGRRFRPFGLEYARIFAKLMIAAGMVLLPDGTAVNEILTFDKEIEAVELKREVKETDDDV